MNKLEFKEWQKNLYSRIDEADGIVKYSSIGGAVGSHNNRTPDEVKRANEQKLDLRRKIEEAAIREQAQREKLKDQAKAEAKKQISEEALHELFGFGKKEDKPIGLSQLKKQEEAPKPQNNNKDKDYIGFARMNRENQEEKKPEPQPAQKPEPKTETKEAPKAEGQKYSAQKQGVMSKLRDGLKNVAKGVANSAQKAVVGTKMDVADAKKWLKNNYKQVRKDEAEKRGHTAGYYKDEFKKKSNPVGKEKEENAKDEKAKTSTTTAEKEGSTASNKRSGNGVHIYVHNGNATNPVKSEKPDNLKKAVSNAKANAVNAVSHVANAKADEDERIAKANAEKEKAEEERENWSANHVKNAEGKQINKNKKGKGKTGAQVKAEEKAEKSAENAEKADDLKNKVKEIKEKTSKKAVETKPEVKAEEKETPKAETKETKEETKKPEVKAEEKKPEVKEAPKAETKEEKPEVKPEPKTEKEVKKPEEKAEEVKETPKAETKEEKKPEVKAEEKKDETKKDDNADVKPANKEEGKTEDKSATVSKPDSEKQTKKKSEIKEEPKAEEKKSETKKEDKTLADKVKQAKENAKEAKTPLEKREAIERIRAKRAQEEKEKYQKRQEEMSKMKAGHEKSDEEIKANNEKVRKERNLPDEETESVKKQEETVSSSWREDFRKRTNSGSTEGLPEKVKTLMGKYKNYWGKVNAKDHSMTKDEMAEGDRLENELKSTMREHPDAFGKKTTVKDGEKKSDGQIKPGKRIDIRSKLAKKKEEPDVDKFIEDTVKDEDGPSDADLKAIEREQKKKK